MSEPTPLPNDNVKNTDQVLPPRSRTALPIGAISPVQANNDVVDGASVSDGDSAFGEDWGSETTSVKDSIRNYRTLLGRTFHNFEGTEYWGPNDEAANEQWDIGHQLYTLVLDGKLHLAPIGSNPQKVLDVGTGTGIWAIDFADAYPSAAVIGTDLSPIQPTWVPSNLKFEIDDCQLPWTFPDNEFDFVHLRVLVGCLSDWPLFYSRAYNAIKPGGWIEHMETDVRCRSDIGSLEPGNAMYDWGDTFIKAGEKMGRTLLIAEQSEQLLKDAGFVDVVSVTLKAPIGPWSDDPKLKEIGNWFLLFLNDGLENLGMYMLVHVLGWSIEEVHVFLARMRVQLKLRSVQGYTKITTTYGRKPLDA